MKKEYDFSKMKGGAIGRYHKSYEEGHTVTIKKEDGTTSVQFFKLEEGAILLEPDVRKFFRSSESVNEALRSLIAIVPSIAKTSERAKPRKHAT